MIDPRALAQNRESSDRAEAFQYAQLCTQIINVLSESVRQAIPYPHRDECLAQATRNLLAWLNKTGP